MRDITQILVNRHELLGAGETLTEHAKWQKEEKQKVELDRESSHGLFKGVFRTNVPLRHVHDVEDGVTRCPNCLWELEDGMCGSCGYQPVSDADYSASETEDSITTHSDETIGYGPQYHHMVAHGIDPAEAAVLSGAYAGRWDYEHDVPAAFDGAPPFSDDLSEEDSFLGEDLDEEEGDDEYDDESAASLREFIEDDDNSVDGEVLRHDFGESEEVPNSDSGEGTETDRQSPGSSDTGNDLDDHMQSFRDQYGLSPNHVLRPTTSDSSDTDGEPHQRRRNRAMVPQVRVTHRPRPSEGHQPMVISSDSDSDEPIVSHSRSRPRLRRQAASENDELEDDYIPSSLEHRPGRNLVQRRSNRDRVHSETANQSHHRSRTQPRQNEAADEADDASDNQAQRADRRRHKRQHHL